MISYRVINILWHKHQTMAETLCRKINKQVALATVTLHTLTSHGTDIRRHLYWRWASIQINCYWKTTTRGIHKKELATGNQPNQGDGHGHEFKSRSYSMASRQIKELATGIQPNQGAGHGHPAKSRSWPQAPHSLLTLLMAQHGIFYQSNDQPSSDIWKVVKCYAHVTLSRGPRASPDLGQRG